MNKRPKNLDMNQLAKRIVDEAVGDEPVTPPPPETNQTAADKRRLDGLKGGVARAEKLTAEQRSEIAKLAASVRWHKVD
ncbi:conserved protein of unknown function [Candidatus Nitrotoga arctica]|uniref:Histone H1 n=2 Tax=Candidatus Nitrotoga arctica TaxID=453162 RepID=A0ABM8YXC8_9PROT|nr:conserved protein of unknown function [Candidatus Nitrotoga arctica]